MSQKHLPKWWLKTIVKSEIFQKIKESKLSVFESNKKLRFNDDNYDYYYDYYCLCWFLGKVDDTDEIALDLDVICSYKFLLWKYDPTH